MRKLFLILMTLTAVSWSLMAQNRNYSGTVVDAGNNEPLIGATVMPVGGGQGTATDIDGNFTLSLPASVKQVKVSYVGYKEQTVALQNGMVVKLSSSSTNLNDVVVVAYGTANKESLTGSVAVVGAKEIEDRPVTSVTSALEGSAPGVNVNSSTGYPGSAPTIRIRGFNSFTSGAQGPLYVVDGLIYNGSIAEINPADVESMSVLKDAASCALYGSRGANGVVLITTKKAKGQGKVDVNFQMSLGAYGLALPRYERLGVDEWNEASLMALANGNSYVTGNDWVTAVGRVAPSFLNGYCKANNIYGYYNADGVLTPLAGNSDGVTLFNEYGKITPGVGVLPGYNDLDWWKAITQTGFRQEYNLNAAGATEKFDVFASMGYLKQKGYVIETDYERFTGRLTSNFRPVSYFKTGINLNGSYTTGSTANVSASGLGYVTNPFLTQFYAPIRPYYEHDAMGNVVYDSKGAPIYNTGAINSGDNILWSTKLNKINNRSINLDGSIYGTAILPYGFEATVRGGMYRYKTFYTDYSNNLVGSQQGLGGLDTEFDTGYSYTFNQSLNWSHEYGNHHVDALLLHENYKTNSDYSYFRLSGQNIDELYILGNFKETSSWMQGIDGYATESYLGRARYNYDQKYFGEFSLNRDGTSQFAKDHRWGTFWSVGASWIISKENFMQSLNWINYLKFRAAYGSVGNNQACGYYNYLNLYSFTSQQALVPTQIANVDLKWEATKTLDLALEGSLFDDRFTFSVGYFDKRNSDLIYPLVLPISFGSLGNSGSNPSQLMNIGEMANHGWELQFGVDIIRNANVKWDFNIDASFVTNKIKKLPNNQNIVGQAYFMGKSRYEKYTYEYAGVDQLNGRALYYMNPGSFDYYYYDADNNWVYDESQYESMVKRAKADGSYVEINGVPYSYKTDYCGRKLMGSALPVVYGSFGSNVSWKGINFGLLFTYSLGGKTFDSNYQDLMGFNVQSPSAIHKDVLKAWTGAPEGMTADSPNRIDKDGVPQFNSQLTTYNDASSSRFLTSASYLSLKNINLSYDLPRKWVAAMRLQNINVGFQMENAFIATARKGLNAQSAIGGAVGSNGAYYQPARTYTFTLGVRF